MIRTVDCSTPVVGKALVGICDLESLLADPSD